MKRWLMSTGITFSILASMIGLSASASMLAVSEQQDAYILEKSSSDVTETALPEKEIDWANMDWETAEFYAYMDLEQAEESIKPMILAARNKIIFQSNDGWVADGMNAYVEDADGNVVEELPQFSDLFPEDWENPTLS